MPSATTDESSDQIRIGADGTLYVGAVGTAAPTAENSVLNAAFKPTGFLTEDGVRIVDSKTVNEKRAWQSRYPVKRWVNSRGYDVSFTLEQINWLTFAFAMGGGTLTEPTIGHYKFVPPAPSDLDERALVIDWEEDTFHYRLWVPQGLVTDNVEFQIQAQDTIMLPITFGAIFNGTDPIYSFFTDDPAFEVSV